MRIACGHERLLVIIQVMKWKAPEDDLGPSTLAHLYIYQPGRGG